MIRFTLAFASFALFALAAAPAAAQQMPDPTHPGRHFAFDGELGTFFGDAVGINDLAVLSPQLRFAGRVTDALELQGGWGFTTGSADVPGDGRAFVPGNPYIGAYFVHQNIGVPELRDTRLSIRAGGGMALPAAGTDTPEERALVRGATGVRGMWNRWKWLPDRTTVRGRVRLDGEVNRAFVWAVEGGMHVMFDTGDEARDTLFDMQLGSELGGRVRNWVFGGRIQMVWAAEGNPRYRGDFVQFALSPFVRFDNYDAFFQASLLMNLDDPLGFGFEEEGLYGLRVAAGARF
jgi:hypothetical protein